MAKVKVRLHAWRESKVTPFLVCSACHATLDARGREDEVCEIAVHEDREVNKLYRARRRAAEKSSGSGWKAVRGWSELEAIELQLKTLAPDGDWRYESNEFDGRGWRVRRP